MSRELFESLLAPNLRGLRRLVRTRVRTPGDAEDVLQEILLRAFSHRDQLRDRAKFGTWLWSIALNEIRAFFRRDRSVVSIEDFAHFDVRDRAISPLARLEQNETREWLRSCMTALTERDQHAIRLRDFEGRSVRQAAAALNSSESAAKTTHFRARRKLACIVRETAHRSAWIPSLPAA